MKKKLLLIMCALCLMVFSGCGGCKHEWTEADCLTAKTCNLCQETEGTALGHDWTEADCENPQICTRCGLTQGEALGHSYGKWTMAEEKMTHTCERCGGEEAVEPDYDVYLQQEMPGHWDLNYLYLDGRAITGNQSEMNLVLYHLDVTGENLSFYDMVETKEYTWACENHTVQEAGVQYWVLGYQDGEAVFSVAFLDFADQEDLLLIPIDSENYMVMTRNEDAVGVLEGTWVASDQGKGYSVNFCKDGSFSGSFPEGARSGTWHLKTVGATYGSSINATINLCYEQDGEAMVSSGSIYFGSAESDWSTYRNNASISLSGTGLNFRWLGEDQLGTWETALTEGPQKLVGEWTGMEERNNDYQSGEYITTIPEGYTVTFLEDGTLTAVLGDEEITGIWYFDDVTISYGNVSYSYKWKQKETDKEEHHISLYNGGNLNMNLPAGRNKGRSVEFMQLTEENLATMAEAKTKPVGVWTSTRRSEMNGETGIREEGMTTAYSLEILEDGTFVAHLEEDFTGKWMFGDLHTYDNGIEIVTNYMYNCEVDAGHVQDMSFTLQSDGTLTFNYTAGEIYGYMDFAQMDAAQKAALDKEIEEAQLIPVGTWVSHTYTTWDSNTQQGKDESHSGYTLTIREDGTLTGQMEQAVESTWSLSSIYHGDGYTSYSYGTVQDQDKAWYISYHDGLSLSYYEDGISYSIAFEKQ